MVRYVVEWTDPSTGQPQTRTFEFQGCQIAAVSFRDRLPPGAHPLIALHEMRRAEWRHIRYVDLQHPIKSLRPKTAVPSD